MLQEKYENYVYYILELSDKSPVIGGVGPPSLIRRWDCVKTCITVSRHFDAVIRAAAFI